MQVIASDRHFLKVYNTFSYILSLYILDKWEKNELYKTKKYSSKTYEFVGPICESTDKFLSVKRFQKLKEKELVIICDVGAYGSSLSSNYNLRSKPAEILVKGSKIIITKKRQKLKDFI